MIEIHISEGKVCWAAVVTQWADADNIARVLCKTFKSGPEAWAWAQKTQNRWKGKL